MTIHFVLPRFDGEAACAETDPDSFFPDKGGDGPVMAGQAKRICHRCEVIDQCLQWALDNAEPHGVWGGLTERERRRITGRSRKAVA